MLGALPNNIDFNNPAEKLPLPLEVLSHIFSFLPPQDLLNVGLINKLFQQFSQSPHFWKGLIERYFPYLKETERKAYQEDAKSLFISTYQNLTSKYCKQLSKCLFHAALIGDVEKVEAAVSHLTAEKKRACFIVFASHHPKDLKKCAFWQQLELNEKNIILREACLLAAVQGYHNASQMLLKEFSHNDRHLSSIVDLISTYYVETRGAPFSVLKAPINKNENAREMLKEAVFLAHELNQSALFRYLLNNIHQFDSDLFTGISTYLASAMILAAESGRYEEVKKLLILGVGTQIGVKWADIHVQTMVLGYACRRCDFNMMKLILDAYEVPQGDLKTILPTLTQTLELLLKSKEAKLLHQFFQKMCSLKSQQLPMMKMLKEGLIDAAKQGDVDLLKTLLMVASEHYVEDSANRRYMDAVMCALSVIAQEGDTASVAIFMEYINNVLTTAPSEAFKKQNNKLKEKLFEIVRHCDFKMQDLIISETLKAKTYSFLKKWTVLLALTGAKMVVRFPMLLHRGDEQYELQPGEVESEYSKGLRQGRDDGGLSALFAKQLCIDNGKKTSPDENTTVTDLPVFKPGALFAAQSSAHTTSPSSSEVDLATLFSGPMFAVQRSRDDGTTSLSSGENDTRKPEKKARRKRK